MLRHALAVLVVLSLAPTWAQAQPAPPGPSSAGAQPESVLGTGAMPGGLQVADAAVLPAHRLGMTTLASFGYRQDLLASGHRLRRGAGSLALSYSLTSWLSLGLALDGRYDRHYGIDPSGEDGYVGDSRLHARVAFARGRLRVGAQLGLWVPGKDAPSFAFSATTVELRGLASAQLGLVDLSLNAGFRLDNSAASVDDPERLTLQDQVSLGVSDFHAVTLGARAALPLRRVFVAAELSADRFVGSDAPPATVRGALSAGARLTRSVSLFGYLQLASAADPSAQLMTTGTVPLLPYESRVTLGLGLAARFGGEAAPVVKRQLVVDEGKPTQVDRPKEAALTGLVVDDAGEPLVGAKVTVQTGDRKDTTVTDRGGRFRVDALPLGSAKITVELAGKKTRETTLALEGGEAAVPRLQLDPDLPPGELRGNVRARVGGRAIAGATVTVEPGGFSAVTAADGSFALEVPPGKYTVTTSAAGYAPQVIEAVVDQEGVTVKFINLDKPRKE
ncbi:MAG TPA: carboxypeptidase regulatory-like domain-containing protein [Kofleriaceae bacterium]|nr:carboxypeptidase regulatory-like domain-containing protein [Kofleriaceae bacterium]